MRGIFIEEAEEEEENGKVGRAAGKLCEGGTMRPLSTRLRSLPVDELDDREENELGPKRPLPTPYAPVKRVLPLGP